VAEFKITGVLTVLQIINTVYIVFVCCAGSTQEAQGEGCANGISWFTLLLFYSALLLLATAGAQFNG